MNAWPTTGRTGSATGGRRRMRRDVSWLHAWRVVSAATRVNGAGAAARVNGAGAVARVTGGRR